ncbi:hypothetical protein FRC00_003000 [Tulasnella sp. 408]|nr:hypothetical protein FRC00_003000 [Tulasnella sp. 408]
MNTSNHTPPNALILEVPEPPEEFGQDGGKFYKAYDAIAEEIDDDMTKSLKEQLDGMLIFAGLFAGVNSAFLALTLPLMSADPVDDTNALLAQNNAILMQLASGRNDSAPLDSPVPSKSFAPSGAVLSVNVLFALSLAFAIVSSFLAVLGRQWLVYYRKRSGGGPDRQRWEQLKRFLGAERWGLELVLDDILPSLLQTGLIIFCISLVIYLNSLNSTLSFVVGIPLCLALAFFIGSAMCTMWDRFCPFHSPLSHFLQWVSTSAPRLATIAVSFMYQKVKSFSFCVAVSRWIPQFDLMRRLRQVFCISQFRQVKHLILRLKRPFKLVYEACKQLLDQLPQPRKEEDRESLQVTALQRTICTSEDTASLLHATANILALANSDQLKIL